MKNEVKIDWNKTLLSMEVDKWESWFDIEVDKPRRSIKHIHSKGIARFKTKSISLVNGYIIGIAIKRIK